jgi:DNA-binding NarL/FixJ family response regulator
MPSIAKCFGPSQALQVKWPWYGAAFLKYISTLVSGSVKRITEFTKSLLGRPAVAQCEELRGARSMAPHVGTNSKGPGMRIATIGFSCCLTTILKDVSKGIIGVCAVEKAVAWPVLPSFAELSRTDLDVVIICEPDLHQVQSIASRFCAIKWILILDPTAARDWTCVFSLSLNGLLALPVRERSLRQSLMAARDGSFFSDIPLSGFGGTRGMRNPKLTGVLTPREWQIMDLLRTGQSFKEIANQLHLSTETVNNHVRNVRAKLGVQSSAKAMHVAYSPSIQLWIEG